MSKINFPALGLDYEALRDLSMRSLFESLEAFSEGTVIVDANAAIVWINERYAARFGKIFAADAIGLPVEKVIPSSLMRQVVTTGQPILLDLLETATVTFVVTRIPLKDEAGNIIGAAGFAWYDQVQALNPLLSKLKNMQRELAFVQKRLVDERRTKYTFSSFIGSSPACMEVKRQGRRAAQLDSTLLLLGETGTGKEILAHAIHAASGRWEKPFVGINVAAIPETLLEAEFFGVAPGAYTGAEKRGRDGKFKLAEGGTLFLDEIGDMPLALQSKLLRVLQEQEFEAVGSNRVTPIDVRIIAATSVNLLERVNAGLFRADLYYRLNVLSITVPPLRDRPADMDALCEHILERIERRSGFPPRELTPEVIARFKTCFWRGNVRELQNVLEKALMFSEKLRLELADIENILPPESLPRAENASHGDFSEQGIRASQNSQENQSYSEAFDAFERALLLDALARCHHRAEEVAKSLGLTRATCYRKLRAHGLLSQQ